MYYVFLGSYQTESQLNTARLALMNAPNNNKAIESSTCYKHTLPVFEDIMNSCKTKCQFGEVIKLASLHICQ